MTSVDVACTMAWCSAFYCIALHIVEYCIVFHSALSEHGLGLGLGIRADPSNRRVNAYTTLFRRIS